MRDSLSLCTTRSSPLSPAKVQGVSCIQKSKGDTELQRRLRLDLLPRKNDFRERVQCATLFAAPSCTTAWANWTQGSTWSLDRMQKFVPRRTQQLRRRDWRPESSCEVWLHQGGWITGAFCFACTFSSSGMVCIASLRCQEPFWASDYCRLVRTCRQENSMASNSTRIQHSFSVLHRADCMIAFSLFGDGKEHICELQLIHKELMTGL